VCTRLGGLYVVCVRFWFNEIFFFIRFIASVFFWGECNLKRSRWETPSRPHQRQNRNSKSWCWCLNCVSVFETQLLNLEHSEWSYGTVGCKVGTVGRGRHVSCVLTEHMDTLNLHKHMSVDTTFSSQRYPRSAIVL
jgi:hypothetical protein